MAASYTQLPTTIAERPGFMRRAARAIRRDWLALFGLVVIAIGVALLTMLFILGSSLYKTSVLATGGGEMTDVARRYGRVFSGGSQRVLQDYRKVVHPCWAGEHGPIKSINVNVGPFPKECNKAGQPIPDGFDWDMWLGPAPWAPYHPFRCGRAYGLSGKGFRSWYDYSGGMTSERVLRICPNLIKVGPKSSSARRSRRGAGLMDLDHDAVQLGVDFLARPHREPCVLGHLEAARRYSTGIRGLPGSEEHTVLHQEMDRVGFGRHVGPLGHDSDTVRREVFRVFDVDLVLCGAGERDVGTFDRPGSGTLVVCGAEVIGVLADAAAAVFLEILEKLELVFIDAVGIVNESVGIRCREYHGAALQELLDAVERDIAGS